MNQKSLDTLKHFVGFCKKELEIQSLPKITLTRDRSFVENYRSFGEYNPTRMSIRVFTVNRNLADICRSLAHELVHHRQQELGLIYDTAGNTGTEIENDANAIAGILMREYGKLNLSVYDLPETDLEPLKEAGKIENPFPWDFDFEDEDGNYFYSFKTPKHTYSVGFTWNGDSSYELIFDTEGDMGQDTGEGAALRVLSTITDIAASFVKEVEPEELIFRPIKTKGAKDERRFRVYGVYLKKNLPSNYTLYTFGDTYRAVKK